MPRSSQICWKLAVYAKTLADAASIVKGPGDIFWEFLVDNLAIQHKQSPQGIAEKKKGFMSPPVSDGLASRTIRLCFHYKMA